MANTKQAKKRALQNDRQRDRNRSIRSATRSTLKKVRDSFAAEPTKAAEHVPTAASTLDVAVRKGVLHKRTASRLKSRIAKAAGKAAASASK